MAQRTPTLLVCPVWANGSRTEVRNAAAKLSQEPPRAIREKPVAAPGGLMGGEDA